MVKKNKKGVIKDSNYYKLYDKGPSIKTLMISGLIVITGVLVGSLIFKNNYDKKNRNNTKSIWLYRGFRARN